MNSSTSFKESNSETLLLEPAPPKVHCLVSPTPDPTEPQQCAREARGQERLVERRKGGKRSVEGGSGGGGGREEEDEEERRREEVWGRGKGSEEGRDGRGGKESGEKRRAGG